MWSIAIRISRHQHTLLIGIVILAIFPAKAWAAQPRYLFGTPQLVEGINMPDVGEVGPSLTEDGLEIFFARYETQAGEIIDCDIYGAQRDSKEAPFGAPVVVDTLSRSPICENTPAISPDGLTLRYVRAAETGQIWAASRASRTEPFGTTRKPDTLLVRVVWGIYDDLERLAGSNREERQHPESPGSDFDSVGSQG
jgi:hypothetical protein